jgi:Uma2 family endonuclease
VEDVLSSLAQSLHTPEEYLELERKAKSKSEYLNGRILAMAGASVEHNTITSNLVRSLGNAFLGRPCRVFSSDMRVKVSATGLYTYPDVLALCGDLLFDDLHRDTIANPAVIIEVLSPSTEAYDRGEKFAHYRRLDSLTDYVLVTQDKILVEHFVRQGSLWVLDEKGTLEDTLHLTSIGCDLQLGEIYDKVDVSQEPESGSSVPKANPT